MARYPRSFTLTKDKTMNGIVEISWPVGGSRWMVVLAGNDEGILFATPEAALAYYNANKK